MIIEFAADDGVLDQNGFRRDEAACNLLLLIVGSRQSLRLTNRTRKLIFAQTPGQNAWLWIAEQTADEERDRLLQQLIAWLQKRDVRLPGVTGLPRTAELMAERYCAARGMTYDTHMRMESYSCPAPSRKPDVRGRMRPAGRPDAPLVAAYVASFAEEALGGQPDPAAHAAAAEWLVSTGNLYLWTVGDEVVSMANIAHRSSRHGRINSVFTPESRRRNGFATALVAELCGMLHRERLVPMLYADQTNPDSNKVYRNVGFEPSGTVIDIRFSGG